MLVVLKDIEGWWHVLTVWMNYLDHKNHYVYYNYYLYLLLILATSVLHGLGAHRWWDLRRVTAITATIFAALTVLSVGIVTKSREDDKDDVLPYYEALSS